MCVNCLDPEEDERDRHVIVIAVQNDIENDTEGESNEEEDDDGDGVIENQEVDYDLSLPGTHSVSVCPCAGRVPLVCMSYVLQSPFKSLSFSSLSYGYHHGQTW
jgi:hypothetical protein